MTQFDGGNSLKHEQIVLVFLLEHPTLPYLGNIHFPVIREQEPGIGAGLKNARYPTDGNETVHTAENSVISVAAEKVPLLRGDVAPPKHGKGTLTHLIPDVLQCLERERWMAMVVKPLGIGLATTLTPRRPQTGTEPRSGAAETVGIVVIGPCATLPQKKVHRLDVQDPGAPGVRVHQMRIPWQRTGWFPRLIVLLHEVTLDPRVVV